MAKKRTAFFLLFLFLSLNNFTLFSDDSDQDLYTQKLRYPEVESENYQRSQTLTRWLLGLPNLPWKMVRKGLDPALNYIEETHLVKKVDWAWKEIKKYGFHPEARFSPIGFVPGIGLKIQGNEFFKTDESLPFLKYDMVGGYAGGGCVDFGGGYRAALPSNPSIYNTGRATYERLPLQSFFGIGPHTSRGDQAIYSQEELRLEERVGYEPTTTTKTEGFFRYRHVNIGNGHLEEHERMKERYTGAQVPGINGTDLLNAGFLLSHDTRDMEEDPLRGGYQQLDFSYSDDVHGQNFHYLKFDFHAAHFFQLWSDRKVFALKFFVGRAQKTSGGDVPFFDLERIGGYGIQPSGSETLRGFVYNRFFDKTALVITPEYRYNIWKYGNFNADSVFFADVGEVFREIHSFGLDKLKPSYGWGIRVKHSRDVFFSFEIAHSNEGTQIYVRTKAPF